MKRRRSGRKRKICHGDAGERAFVQLDIFSCPHFPSLLMPPLSPFGYSAVSVETAPGGLVAREPSVKRVLIERVCKPLSWSRQGDVIAQTLLIGSKA